MSQQSSSFGGFRGRMDGKGKTPFPGFKEDSVMMSYIESATLMWVQRGTQENAKELMELSNQLSQVCPRASVIKQPPLLGKIYGTRFTQDDMWYRCMVRQIASEDKVTVHFIDYGNSEDKNPRDLVEIPNSLTGIRAFAYKTLLHNLSSKDNDQKAMEFLRSKTEGKLLKVQQTKALADGTGYYVHLIVENENLGDEMVKQGLASYRVTNNQTARPAQPNARFGEWSKPDTDTSRQEQGLKSQLEKEKAEKDMLVLELSNLKGRFLTLQTEYNGMSNRLSDSSTSHKIQMSVNLSDRVHKLRCEFAMKDEDDLILAGIAKLNDNDKLLLKELACLQKMLTAEKHLHDIQTEIKAAVDMEPDRLKDLSVQRDGRRKEFCSRIEEFETVVSKLPLTGRNDKLQSLCSLIERRYHAFLMFIVNSCPELDQVEAQYRTWKAQHIDEFSLVRCETDTHQQTVTNALSKLLSLLCLSVDSPDHDVPNDGELDLDSLLKTATTALQREIAVTNVLHSKDACLLATVIHTLHKTAKTELDDVQEIIQLQDTYKKYLIDYQKWVSTQPDLNEIRCVRKETRTLKSQIRHLSADLQDLEETEDSKESDKLALKSKLDGLHSDLATKMGKEGQIISDLTRTCETHFPEIFHLHKDLNLGSHQETLSNQNGPNSCHPETQHQQDHSVTAALEYFRKQAGLDDASIKKPSHKSTSVQTSSSQPPDVAKLKVVKPVIGAAKVSLLDSPIEAKESGELMTPLLSQPSPPQLTSPKHDTVNAHGDSCDDDLTQVSAEDTKKINDITTHLLDELLKSLHQTGAEYNSSSFNTKDIKEQLAAIFSAHHGKLLENRSVPQSSAPMGNCDTVQSQCELDVTSGATCTLENELGVTHGATMSSQTQLVVTSGAGDASSQS